eukprot:TRINITY_DN28978_c0_g1_i1.p1 TRINITY_DN28978_c0_g1~~TRINITY_DN28978_c0_g1_i1.p1  ORF type:complete len:451 (-),score=52.32 TRINITY_DN28978_c0_g1_i1:44-1396(-)
MESPMERFLAPVAVLGLQALLLVDVASHHAELLHVHRAREALEWLVAAAAILTYLRTVISDPGFLRVSTTSIGSKLPALAGWLSCFAAPCAAVCACFCACRRFSSHTAGKDATPTGGAREMRDIKEANAAELQPIGRSVLDAIASTEVESDPGEETIELADLEMGAQFGRSAKNLPDKHKNGRGQEGESLGKIPGSPRPGTAQKRRERDSRDQDRSGPGTRVYWQERYQGPQGEERRVVMQSGQKLRFCKTCNLHQPLRTKHCRDCGHCVRTHDHHCPWVGTCVGEGNRLYFYWFLVAQWTELTVFLVEAILEVAEDGFSPPVWVSENPLLLLGILVMGLLEIMVTCLLCFHTYLALTNMTTWENMSWYNISYLRGLPPEDGSPFSISLKTNLAAYCCLPLFPELGCCAGSPAPVKLTEDGYAIWDLGEQHNPLNIECCGHHLCSCFDVE